MSINSISSSVSAPQRAPQVLAPSNADGDEATESVKAKAQEKGTVSSSQSLPADPNKGRNVNIVA